MKVRCTTECAEDFKRIENRNTELVLAAARQTTNDYTAWLIEISDEAAGPKYFQMSDDDDWTRDHNAALHLARKQDAESIINYYGWNRAHAVEHMWPVPRSDRGSVEA